MLFVQQQYVLHTHCSASCIQLKELNEMS